MSHMYLLVPTMQMQACKPVSYSDVPSAMCQTSAVADYSQVSKRADPD